MGTTSGLSAEVEERFVKDIGALLDKVGAEGVSMDEAVEAADEARRLAHLYESVVEVFGNRPFDNDFSEHEGP